MKELRIPFNEVAELLSGKKLDFPKYSTQLINLANQNAQGTRPKVVGQLSDLIQEFDGKTYDEWVLWYKGKMPTAIDDATEKIWGMVKNLEKTNEKITKELVQEWVEDLVLTKTFAGLKFQEAILKKIADEKGVKCRLATPAEESEGIDGYIGDTSVSIKPTSYKTKSMLPEKINVKKIFYEKKEKEGLYVYYDF